MHLKMVESESTCAYMKATREYIDQHGEPVPFYSDQHSVFQGCRDTAIEVRSGPDDGGARQPKKPPRI